MSILKLIWKDSAFRLCLVFVLMQQILVACGTYLMGDLASNLAITGISIPKIFILALSLVLSGSLFHYLMKYQLKLAEKNILWSVFQKYKVANYSKPWIWRNATEKQDRHDVIIKEGQDSVSSSVHFAADSVATVLNIIFNSVSVILVTSPILGLSIFVAGFLGLWIVHLADSAIAKTAREEMEAQNSVNAHLIKSWDNIVLGNQTNLKRWHTKFKEIFELSKEKSLNNVRTNDAAVAIAGFITSLVVIITVFTLVFVNYGDKAKVIALLVMLPRSMQIVMHIQVIQSYLAHWKYLLQRLRLTEKACFTVNVISLDEFISYDEISLQPLVDEKTLLNANAGRFTIKGKNGAGKSTFLLKLKSSLSGDGLYIPSHHNLELSSDTLAMSSGQLAMCAINDALNDPARVILLDEWDANLSKDNRIEINEAIETLSKSKVVIEVRHHA